MCATWANRKRSRSRPGAAASSLIHHAFTRAVANGSFIVCWCNTRRYDDVLAVPALPLPFCLSRLECINYKCKVPEIRKRIVTLEDETLMRLGGTRRPLLRHPSPEYLRCPWRANVVFGRKAVNVIQPVLNGSKRTDTIYDALLSSCILAAASTHLYSSLCVQWTELLHRLP